MTGGQLSRRVVVDRLDWAEAMIAKIHALPLESMAAFLADQHSLAAAESYLRRALEALLDLGRHILAKGFGKGVSEYREIAVELGKLGVLSSANTSLLATLAGYRNRMVHFYHEVSAEELYQICSAQLKDLELIAKAFRSWLKQHPEKLDESL